VNCKERAMKAIPIHGSVPSFFDAVAHRARVDLPGPSEESWISKIDEWIATRLTNLLGIRFGPTKELPYLKFSGDRYNFQAVQASEFIKPDPGRKSNKASDDQKKSDASEKDRVPAVMPQPFDGNEASLPNRIVLIGGAYGSARDEYATPRGRMQGVELLASGVETEIHQGVTSIWWPFVVLLDLVVGTVVVWIYYKWHDRPRRALLASFAAMFGVVLLGTFFYYGLGAFLNFVPIMAGMVLHQLYDGTKEVSELQKELQERHTEIKELRAKLAQAQGGLESSPLPHGEVHEGSIDGAAVIKKTVVETDSEELHVESPSKGKAHRRAAGKPG
jgi:hypothetical protein